jgi:ubiquinone/menaquinone biosynthesis C-methylase UbiE
MAGELFPPSLELLPEVTEVYEMELAYYESRLLTDDELIRNGAYFARVGDTLTRHFLMCKGEPVRLPQHSSSRLKSFFQTKQFKTGYATHGLFPYRGKFHPQMIKGLLNIMGLKPGDTVLDPMMGSGTVLIEAALMGIKSIGVDASPFCALMVQAKLDGLSVNLDQVRKALENGRAVFDHFSALGRPQIRRGKKIPQDPMGDLFPADVPLRKSTEGVFNRTAVGESAYRFLQLAFLDSAGYSERSQRKSPFDQFIAILERYLFVSEKIQRVLAGAESDVASASVAVGDARALKLDSGSIDGVLFSPPYSFAVDYLANDAFHLDFLRINQDDLKQQMVGLRGVTLREKFELYKTDMSAVLSECSRVLRKNGLCTIVVGTNTNQLSKLLEVEPADVQGIDALLIEMAESHGLKLVRKLSRQITGMANTMRTEFIVMLQRTA